MNLFSYEHKIVRVIDVDGRVFTGIPVSVPADYGFHEFNRDEESIKIGDYQLFESDMSGCLMKPLLLMIRRSFVFLKPTILPVHGGRITKLMSAENCRLI